MSERSTTDTEGLTVCRMCWGIGRCSVCGGYGEGPDGLCVGCDGAGLCSTCNGTGERET